MPKRRRTSQGFVRITNRREHVNRANRLLAHHIALKIAVHITGHSPPHAHQPPVEYNQRNAQSSRDDEAHHEGRSVADAQSCVLLHAPCLSLLRLASQLHRPCHRWLSGREGVRGR